MTQMLRSENKLEMLQAHLGYVLESTLLEEMAQVAKIRETATDEIVVNVGDHLQMIPIVIDGSIKISRERTKVATNYYSITWREVIHVRCLCNVAHEKLIHKSKRPQWNPLCC